MRKKTLPVVGLFTLVLALAAKAGPSASETAEKASSIDFTDGLAVAAIAVSIVTAWLSRASARRTAERQQTFELRFYRLSMLDPAKGKLRQIYIDINRHINVGVQRGLTTPACQELEQLDRDAVNAFHAISHHLPSHGREKIEAIRITLESQRTKEEMDVAFASSMSTYVQEILKAVEDCLQTLLLDSPQRVRTPPGNCRSSR